MNYLQINNKDNVAVALKELKKGEFILDFSLLDDIKIAHKFALCDIKKGEELLYNYGYALEHFLDHPCKCGFPECVGYIVAVEDRLKLKKLLKWKKPKHLRKD